MTFSEGAVTDDHVYALKTRDGATFSVFSTGVDRAARSTDSGVTVTPNEYDQLYIGKSSGEGYISNHLVLSSTLMPKTGKPEVLGTEDMLIDAERE